MRFGIPGLRGAQHATSQPTAWLAGHWETVRLAEDLEAIRVHVGGGTAASFNPRFAFGAGSLGRWFAVGDVILSYSEIKDRYALPDDFTKIELVTLRIGTEVNIGLAAPLFGQRGGGIQAEWVSGPQPEQTTLAGSAWANYYAHA